MEICLSTILLLVTLFREHFGGNFTPELGSTGQKSSISRPLEEAKLVLQSRRLQMANENYILYFENDRELLPPKNESIYSQNLGTFREKRRSNPLRTWGCQILVLENRRLGKNDNHTFFCFGDDWEQSPPKENWEHLLLEFVNISGRKKINSLGHLGMPN